MDHQIAILSEEILGYREGSLTDMVDKIRELKKLELVKEIIDIKDEIVDFTERGKDLFGDL